MIDISKYKIVKQVGKGTFGKVCLLESNTEGNNKLLALKVVELKKLTKSAINDMKLEIDLCGKLDHKNIVKCFKVDKNEDTISFVMEYANGGDLWERVYNQKLLSEFEIQKVAKDILNALSYCHKKKICHHDLKPENILAFKDKNEQVTYKLADWGLADITDENLKYKGTVQYLAPEFFKDNHSHFCDKTDIWALGVLLYTCSEGKYPFDGVQEKKTIENIKKVNYSFTANTSNKLQEFIRKLLEKDPDKRLKADQALEEEFIKAGSYLNTLVFNRTLTVLMKDFLPPFPNNLEKLTISSCSVKNLPELPESLKQLRVNFCTKLENLPKLPGKLEILEINDCRKVKVLPNLPDSINSIICSTSGLETLNNLPKNLILLEITECENLVSVGDLPNKLEIAKFDDCENLETIGKLSKSLKKLSCNNCANLKNIAEDIPKNCIFSCNNCDNLKK